MQKTIIAIGLLAAASTACTGEQRLGITSQNVEGMDGGIGSDSSIADAASGTGSDGSVATSTTDGPTMCGDFVVPLGMPLCDSNYTPWVPDNDPDKGIIWSASETTSGGGCTPTEGDSSGSGCTPAPATREITVEGSEAKGYKDTQTRKTDRRGVVQIGPYQRDWSETGTAEVTFEYEVGASWTYKATVPATDFRAGIKPDGTAQFDGKVKCITWATATRSTLTGTGGTNGVDWGLGVKASVSFKPKDKNVDIGVDVLKLGVDNVKVDEWKRDETTKNVKKANVEDEYDITAGQSPLQVCRDKDWVRDNLPTTQTTIKQVTETIANLIAQGWRLEVLGQKPVVCKCQVQTKIVADCKSKDFVYTNWDQWRSWPGTTYSVPQDFDPSILSECSTKYATAGSAGRALVEADLSRQCIAWQPTAFLQGQLDDKCKKIQGSSFQYAWGHRYCRVCDWGDWREKPPSCDSDAGKVSMINGKSDITCAIEEM